MVRLVDKLNTPWLLAVVLVLFLIVDGLLLYRYQLVKGTAAATPSVDARLAMDREEVVVDASAQQAPGAEETAEEGEQPEGEEQGAFGIEEIEPEPGTAEAPPLAASPSVEGPTSAPGEEEPAALPLPEPAYSEPASSQSAFEQYDDYQYGDYQYGDG